MSTTGFLRQMIISIEMTLLRSFSRGESERGMNDSSSGLQHDSSHATAPVSAVPLAVLVDRMKVLCLEVAGDTRMQDFAPSLLRTTISYQNFFYYNKKSFRDDPARTRSLHNVTGSSRPNGATTGSRNGNSRTIGATTSPEAADATRNARNKVTLDSKSSARTDSTASVGGGRCPTDRDLMNEILRRTLKIQVQQGEAWGVGTSSSRRSLASSCEENRNLFREDNRSNKCGQWSTTHVLARGTKIVLAFYAMHTCLCLLVFYHILLEIHEVKGRVRFRVDSDLGSFSAPFEEDSQHGIIKIDDLDMIRHRSGSPSSLETTGTTDTPANTAQMRTRRQDARESSWFCKNEQFFIDTDVVSEKSKLEDPGASEEMRRRQAWIAFYETYPSKYKEIASPINSHFAQKLMFTCPQEHSVGGKLLTLWTLYCMLCMCYLAFRHFVIAFGEAHPSVFFVSAFIIMCRRIAILIPLASFTGDQGGGAAVETIVIKVTYFLHVMNMNGFTAHLLYWRHRIRQHIYDLEFIQTTTPRTRREEQQQQELTTVSAFISDDGERKLWKERFRRLPRTRMFVVGAIIVSFALDCVLLLLDAPGGLQLSARAAMILLVLAASFWLYLLEQCHTAAVAARSAQMNNSPGTTQACDLSLVLTAPAAVLSCSSTPMPRISEDDRRADGDHQSTADLLGGPTASIPEDSQEISRGKSAPGEQDQRGTSADAVSTSRTTPIIREHKNASMKMAEKKSPSSCEVDGASNINNFAKEGKGNHQHEASSSGMSELILDRQTSMRNSTDSVYPLTVVPPGQKNSDETRSEEQQQCQTASKTTVRTSQVPSDAMAVQTQRPDEQPVFSNKHNSTIQESPPISVISNHHRAEKENEGRRGSTKKSNFATWDPQLPQRNGRDEKVDHHFVHDRHDDERYFCPQHERRYKLVVFFAAVYAQQVIMPVFQAVGQLGQNLNYASLRFLLWHVFTILWMTAIHSCWRAFFRNEEPSLCALLVMPLQLMANIIGTFQIFRMGLGSWEYYVSLVSMILFESYRDTRLWYHIVRLSRTRSATNDATSATKTPPSQRSDSGRREEKVDVEDMIRNYNQRKHVAECYAILRWNLHTGWMETIANLVVVALVLTEFFLVEVFPAHGSRYRDVAFLLGVDNAAFGPNFETGGPVMGSLSREEKFRLTPTEFLSKFAGLVLYLLAEHLQVHFCREWNFKILINALRDLVLQESKRNKTGELNRERIETAFFRDVVRELDMVYHNSHLNLWLIMGIYTIYISCTFLPLFSQAYV